MLPEFLSNEWILVYGGLCLTILIIFSETAFPIGIIIPGGETLLFTSGLLAGTQWIPVNFLLISIPITLFAFIADLIAYTRGFNKGLSIYEEEEKFYFRKKYLRVAQKANTKYGKLSLVLGRFFPVLRTFSPLVLGAHQTDFQSFFTFSGIGCVIYVNSLITAGYFVGKFFPELRGNIQYIIAAVVFFIFATPLIVLIKYETRKKKEKEKEKLNQYNP